MTKHVSSSSYATYVRYVAYRIHTYRHRYLLTYLHACIHTCIHTYVYTYIIYTYIHIYIHTRYDDRPQTYQEQRIVRR